MTNVLKEIAYNSDFFANPDTYLFTISSSNDGDYIATFMTEEMYQNPPTELDKIYVAEFKAFKLDRQMYQELAIVIEDVLDQGYEQGTDEFYKKVEEQENIIIEKYENMKREIPYYDPEKSRLDVLKELEQKDYWNKAGLYYWIYKNDYNQPIEYLEKAEKAYQIDKNGKDDLFSIYLEFIQYNLWQDNQKVIEYIEKANGLFVTNEFGEDRVANMQDVPFYTYAAYCLASSGEYEKALSYMDKFFGKVDTTGVPFETYFALERGVLMYLSQQKDEAVQYLKDGLSRVENEEYVDESLRIRYIWALKSIARLEAK